MKKRKSYSPKFKAAAVAMCSAPGKAANSVATELGIAASMLSRWRNAPLRQRSHADSQCSPKQPTRGDPEELRLLRAVLERLPNCEGQRYAAVYELRDEFCTSLLCAALGVSRSGYYAWRVRNRHDDGCGLVGAATLNGASKTKHGDETLE